MNALVHEMEVNQAIYDVKQDLNALHPRRGHGRVSSCPQRTIQTTTVHEFRDEETSTIVIDTTTQKHHETFVTRTNEKAKLVVPLEKLFCRRDLPASSVQIFLPSSFF